MFSRPQKGILLALFTALISGFSIFLNKYAVEAVRDPLVFTTLKNTGVALIILNVLAWHNDLPKIKLLTNKEKWYLLIIGIIGGSIPFYLFFTGLSMIPAINGAIIQKTLVIWVSILAMRFLKEKLTPGRILAVAVLFSANVLVGGFKGFTFSVGEFYVLMATLLWSVEIILAKKVLPKVDTDLVTAARMGIGAIVLLAMSLVLKPMVLVKSVTSLSQMQAFWVIASIILLFAYVTAWYRALKFAPAITVTSVLVASTLVTNILTVFSAGHSINSTLILQFLLMSAGIFLLYRSDNKKLRAHQTAIK